jgi:prepilin-type N-terminal cleavage/methylation domain-containing protein/prepilin-type processing-associated H-X9-DG protein
VLQRLKMFQKVRFLARQRTKAFTLIELLVVISITTLLLSILLPVLNSAKSAARDLVCRSNLRQLLFAGNGYATENDGFCVPAASDMWNNAGLHRWHGVRDNLNKPFDPLRGPLASYLKDGEVKICPEMPAFIKGQDWNTNFEQGCGGYGYNMTYIGSRLWQSCTESSQALKDAYARTTRFTEISSPARTLMFADTAMSNAGNSLIEYSFAEPPFSVYYGQLIMSFYMSPSIHFRHNSHANIGWSDGHTESRWPAKSEDKNVYNVESAKMNLGWFAPIDNSPFDLE